MNHGETGNHEDIHNACRLDFQGLYIYIYIYIFPRSPSRGKNRQQKTTMVEAFSADKSDKPSFRIYMIGKRRLRSAQVASKLMFFFSRWGCPSGI